MSRVRIWCRGKLPKSSDLAGLGLLIVSPLINMMDGKKDMNREQDARAFLATWQAQRKEGGCTTIGTAHLNKKNDFPDYAPSSANS